MASTSKGAFMPTCLRFLVVLCAITAGIHVPAHGVTPTRPLEVTTQFTQGSGLTCVLVARVVAHKPVREVRISITAPASFTARFAKGEPKPEIKGIKSNIPLRWQIV